MIVLSSHSKIGEDAALNYVLTLWHYIHNKELFSHVVFYEEFIEDPKRTLMSLLKKFGLNKDVVMTENVNFALEVLSEDSQFGVKTRISHQNGLLLNNKIEEATKKLLQIYNISLSFDSNVEEFRDFLKLI